MPEYTAATAAATAAAGTVAGLQRRLHSGCTQQLARAGLLRTAATVSDVCTSTIVRVSDVLPNRACTLQRHFQQIRRDLLHRQIQWGSVGILVGKSFLCSAC
jgi:hypothetical protein